MLNLEDALDYHLRYNHYPPVTDEHLHKAARFAIDRANDGETGLPVKWEEENGQVAEILRNQQEVTVWDIMEDFHLWPFVTDWEADEWD